MADKWRAVIRYAGHSSSSWTFEDFATIGARVNMDANRDAIESITITPNRPLRSPHHFAVRPRETGSAG